ncbi:MAG: CDP-alcohol phosphatidyltransferase family protein [Candidatus Woesearchaeota archaeon]
MVLQRLLDDSRSLRSRVLDPAAKVLLRIGLTANQLTFLSFIFGLLTVYFLFKIHYLFIIFAVLHLLADAFDGVLARLTQPTNFGTYFDYLTDQSITLLLFIKVYLYLHDYYILLILAMFVLTQSIYLLSKFQSPIFFLRTFGLILISLFPLFPPTYLTLVYLLGGTVTLYSLILQLNYFIRITKIS